MVGGDRFFARQKRLISKSSPTSTVLLEVEVLEVEVLEVEALEVEVLEVGI